MKFFLLSLFLVINLGGVVKAQNDSVPLETYQRAMKFTPQNLINKKVYNLRTDVTWYKDGKKFWFIDYSQNGPTYFSFDLKSKKKSPLFNHDKLRSALESEVGTRLTLDSLRFQNIEVKDSSIHFQFKENKYEWSLKNEKLAKKDSARNNNNGNRFESISPNKQWKVYRKDHNLFLEHTQTSEKTALSEDGEEGYDYASWYGWFDEMMGEGGARPERFSVSWSSNSNYLFTQICDVRKADKMYLLNYAIDSLYRPSVQSYYRGSPGDSTLVLVTPVIYNIQTKSRLSLDLPINTHINAVGLQFLEGKDYALASWKERGFKKVVLKGIDLKTQEMVSLWEETSNTSIDNFEFRYLEKQDKIVVLSEKSGWKQLYLLDISSSKVTPLTQGNFVVNEISYINSENGEVYYLASGTDTNMNPYYQRLYKVNLEGENQLLTPEQVHHQIQFSFEGDYFVDTISAVDVPSKTVLRNAETGKIVAQLTTANTFWAEELGWKRPETFSLIGKDGKTTIYGSFILPTNFDPNKKYPVLDATYTGPHTQVFPKSFNLAFNNQYFAELGFIVVSIDGLGTAGRSKAFREHSYQNMGDNLRDHVLAITELANRYKFIDAERVGIFGHSAGGYDSGHGILAFPDFYKVAVASSGDHDFRMEKAWWPEMYMGWPITEKYEEVSNITLAKNLKGKLLLVHGGLDHNVNPSATYKLAEALVKENKDFDMLILPSQRHGYVGEARNVFLKRRLNYFVEHLLHKTPRWDYDFE
ncbi:S9 family peptidase [Aegicerativicinus sediminis]|uniref:S9 family peptidase n=1 Tax=Aegicerativicinus sediminis TaxID=2893202 RepID=UPI001E41E378|nr:prolyl oligopeptidase family serine peptidase [Aegicerativicinus sediminis]